MLKCLIDKYELFAIPLALYFFWFSEWFYDENEKIVRSLPNHSSLFVRLLAVAGAISAYWCAWGILQIGDKHVADALIFGFLGFIIHKRFFNTKG